MLDEVSAGVVVYRGESPRKYLLLHYPAGHWDFPKGHIEEGETEETAALRELREETGIKEDEVEINEDFMEEIEYFYNRKNELSHKKVIYFLGKAEKEDITISEEHQGHIWLPYEEAKKKVTFRNAKALLEKAHDYL
ncbi:MAG: NUDIX domain-containing protein [Candidatus Thermoplasmatota archaeon]|nr:NUDIX domain-containing protein [Candidatus Thermoplasmatota archaeon]